MNLFIFIHYIIRKIYHTVDNYSKNGYSENTIGPDSTSRKMVEGFSKLRTSSSVLFNQSTNPPFSALLQCQFIPSFSWTK